MQLGSCHFLACLKYLSEIAWPRDQPQILILRYDYIRHMIPTSDITTPPNLSYWPATLKYFELLKYAVLSPSSVTKHIFPVPGIYFQTSKKSLTQVWRLSSIETSFDPAPCSLVRWFSFMLLRACGIHLQHSTYYTAQWLFVCVYKQGPVSFIYSSHSSSAQYLIYSKWSVHVYNLS